MDDLRGLCANFEYRVDSDQILEGSQIDQSVSLMATIFGENL